MQVVINISKDDYEEICIQARMVEDTGSLFGRIRKAISHGTPLPKGHGRLFDERDIVNGNYEIIGNRIYELEPIVEADRSET